MWPSRVLFYLNLFGFVMIMVDKFCSQRGLSRISEKFFVILALWGGWPCMALSMIIIRHKTRKSSFQTKFIGASVCNFIVIYYVVAGL
jgi:uncharacterized membrane protein YsdA (DUF1294 family)